METDRIERRKSMRAGTEAITEGEGIILEAIGCGGSEGKEGEGWRRQTPVLREGGVMFRDGDGNGDGGCCCC